MQTPPPLVLLLLVLLLCLTGAARPPSADDAQVARWLINTSPYGVLATLDNRGFPFGSVVSHSDGGTGTPYFYLATEEVRDPTGPYAMKDSRASFTVSEADFGLCIASEVQSPNCTKVTLTGEVKFLNISSPVADFGVQILYADHPGFARWPSTHKFGVFMLKIDRIFLVNGYKQAVNLSVRAYYKAAGPN